MMTRQESYIEAVKTFNRWLEQKKLRKTPERFAILKMAWTLPGHFGVDVLHAALEQTRYHVSRATVYNTVSLLEDCGVLRRHQIGGESKYEVGGQNHLHLICNRCGKIIEEKASSDISSLLAPCRYADFTPAYLTAYIYGVCASCAAKARESKTAEEIKNPN